MSNQIVHRPICFHLDSTRCIVSRRFVRAEPNGRTRCINYVTGLMHIWKIWKRSYITLFIGIAQILAQLAFASELENAYSVYCKVPPLILAKAFTLGNHPNAQGFADHNSREHRWLEVGQQLGAMNPLVIAAARGDQALAERQWTAVDAAFSHQYHDGSFEQAAEIDGHVKGPGTRPTTTAFFVAGLCHAIFVMQDSPLSESSKSKIEWVRKRLKPTMEWLSSDENVAVMLHVDNATTNRIFIDAEALLLGGLLVGNEKAISAGRKMLSVGLSKQDANGGFPEGKGFDSSYQSCSLYVLGEIATVTDRVKILPYIRRGIIWEQKRISSDGEVAVTGNTRTGLGQEIYFGKPKGINYPEIIRAFSIYGALSGDKKAMLAAEAIARKH